MNSPHPICFAILFYFIRATSLAADVAPSNNVAATVTNVEGSCVVRLSLPTAAGSPYPVAVDLGPACPGATVATNVAGWWVVLLARTNKFTSGTPLTATLAVVNGTMSETMLSWSDAPEDTTGFGKFLVTDTTTGEQMSYCGPQHSHFGFGRGGSRGPGDRKRFEFDFTESFGVKRPGTYRIQFRGKLPSLLEPRQEVQFETGPLVIMVEEPAIR